jgi:hypothetical protein
MDSLHEAGSRFDGRMASSPSQADFQTDRQTDFQADCQADAREAPPDHRVFLAQRSRTGTPPEPGPEAGGVDDPQTANTQEGSFPSCVQLDSGAVTEVPESAIEFLPADACPELFQAEGDDIPPVKAARAPATAQVPRGSPIVAAGVSDEPSPASTPAWDAEDFILGNPLILDLPFLSTRLFGARISSFVGARLRSESTLEVALKLTTRLGALERPLLVRLHAQRQPLLRNREYTRLQVLFFRFILLFIGFVAGALLVGLLAGRG